MNNEKYLSIDHDVQKFLNNISAIHGIVKMDALISLNGKGRSCPRGVTLHTFLHAYDPYETLEIVRKLMNRTLRLNKTIQKKLVWDDVNFTNNIPKNLQLPLDKARNEFITLLHLLKPLI